MKTLAYAAFSSTTPLVPYEFERREPRENDVVIDILYCGVCHSDLHTINGDWNAKFPVVPGHEIIGKVAKIGDKVSKFKVGDFVGVGCMVDSCMDCEPCKAGLEQFCEEGNTQTYNGVDRIDGMPTQGGYSTNIVVREEFVLKIPSGMDLKSAAPVLCAGITTWSPLRRYGVKKGSKVAVVGLGDKGLRNEGDD